MAGQWDGPFVRFTSPVVNAPVFAKVEYSGNPGEWIASTDMLTVANTVYNAEAFLYKTSTSTEEMILPVHGQSLTQVEVIPAFGDSSFFSYTGAGTQSEVAADFPTAIRITVRDRFLNTVLDPQNLGFWASNSFLDVVPVAASEAGGGLFVNWRGIRPVLDVNNHLTVTYNITRAGVYSVQMRYPDLERPGRADVVRATFAVKGIAGVLNASKTYLFNFPGSGVVAGQEYAFRMQLRDQYGNGVDTLSQNASFAGSGLFGDKTGNVVTAGELRISNANGFYYEVRLATTVADTYRISMVVDTAIVTDNYPIVIKPAPVSVRECTVDASAMSTSVAGKAVTVLVFPRDVYGNVAPVVASQVATLFVVLDAKKDAYVAQTLTSQLFNATTGAFNLTYTPTLAGISALTVAINNMAPFGSPFQGQVHPGVTSAAMSTIVGPGVNGAVAGSEVTFLITARDALGNRCEARRGFELGLGFGTAPGLQNLVMVRVWDSSKDL
jgi:hypothetical protein